MSWEKVIENSMKFHKAQSEVEKNGDETFICPLCGGEAWWGRSSYNGHLHTGCSECGFRSMA